MAPRRRLPPGNAGATMPVVSGAELGTSAAAGSRPLVIVVSPATKADGQRAHSKRGPLFDGHADGRVVVERSHQPFLDGCRRLVELGHDPKAVVVMRHAGSDVDSLRAMLGAAARPTVKERGRAGPRFEPWAPHPCSPAAPGTRESDERLLGQPRIPRARA
jgi:hypothetical protein